MRFGGWRGFSRRFLAMLCLLGMMSGLICQSMLAGADAKVKAAPQDQPFSPLTVVINEIAWAGTASGLTADEWVELYNPGGDDIDLSGWELVADDGTPSISLTGVIPVGGYYLLERTDGTTTSEAEDQTYTGALDNDGENLRLLAPDSTEIDTALYDGRGWPAGSASPAYKTMERKGVIADSDLAWASNNGVTINGSDADGNPINGTPKQPNSALTTAYLARTIVISEIAWAGTKAYFGDEWLELYNPAAQDISLEGWILASDSGSVYISFGAGDSIDAGGFFLLERGDGGVTSAQEDLVYSSGLLADTGEVLRLMAPDRTVIDTANLDSGPWLAGGGSPSYTSMERRKDTNGNIMADGPFAWMTYDGTAVCAHDAAGNDIPGTPGQENWAYTVAPSPTPSHTSTATPTLSNTPTATLTSAPSLTLLINEVAWAGTQADANDEWLELYNPGLAEVDLTGWKLQAADGSPKINLVGGIHAGGYFLLERDENAVADIPADQIYSGALSNSGEALRLYDPTGAVVDSANLNGGVWPAGSSSAYGSMERRGLIADDDTAWITNSGVVANGRDAEGDAIQGTPRRANWAYSVTATPSPSATSTRTPTPTRTRTPVRTPTPSPLVVINEFLPRPAHDWNGDGAVDVYDEFIELMNTGTVEVDLKNWQLDDDLDRGSSPYSLPSRKLRPGARMVFYHQETGIALSDGGSTVRLLRSNGQVVDSYTYLAVKQPADSWCRQPEWGNIWVEGCFPTPGGANGFYGSFPKLPEDGANEMQLCLLPDTLPAAFLRVECGSGGGDIWNDQYWDEPARGFELRLPERMSKWFTFVH